MRRWHQDLSITYRQWRVHSHLAHEGRPTGCPCDEQPGRFRKQRALDCGRSRCQVCHYDKIHGIKNHQQRVADQRFLEQLQNDDD
ncbi:MAG TPA: hypothetical protein VN688_15085 [Gemmataceae bacterium]|nr:hypothetical protein [Gemmataceae bacterium]